MVNASNNSELDSSPGNYDPTVSRIPRHHFDFPILPLLERARPHRLRALSLNVTRRFQKITAVPALEEARDPGTDGRAPPYASGDEQAWV